MMTAIKSIWLITADDTSELATIFLLNQGDDCILADIAFIFVNYFSTVFMIFTMRSFCYLKRDNLSQAIS